MVAHDIGIMGHGALPSKAIRAISIDYPRKMWRVNGLVGSRLIVLQFSTIKSHDRRGKGKGKEEEEVKHIPEQ